MGADRAAKVAIIAIPENDLVTAAESRDPKAQERAEQPEHTEIGGGDRRHRRHCFPPLKGPTTCKTHDSMLAVDRSPTSADALALAPFSVLKAKQHQGTHSHPGRRGTIPIGLKV